jgi:hypothetical protein
MDNNKIWLAYFILLFNNAHVSSYYSSEGYFRGKPQGSPGVLRYYPRRGDLPITSTQPTAVKMLSLNLNT